MNEEQRVKVFAIVMMVLVAAAMMSIGYYIGINKETREARELVNEFQQENECRYIKNDMGIHNINITTQFNFT